MTDPNRDPDAYFNTTTNDAAEDTNDTDLPRRVIKAATSQEVTIGTAESLTGGALCSALVSVSGASAVVRGGIVSYSSDVKAQVLGVSEELLEQRGSVDPQVAEQMAAGARRVLGADIGVSTTGVAGPQAHDGKPVGAVYIGVSTAHSARSVHFELAGDRAQIRAGAVRAGLEELAVELGLETGVLPGRNPEDSQPG